MFIKLHFIYSGLHMDLWLVATKVKIRNLVRYLPVTSHIESFLRNVPRGFVMVSLYLLDTSLNQVGIIKQAVYLLYYMVFVTHGDEVHLGLLLVVSFEFLCVQEVFLKEKYLGQCSLCWQTGGQRNVINCIISPSWSIKNNLSPKI